MKCESGFQNSWKGMKGEFYLFEQRAGELKTNIPIYSAGPIPQS
jgi:hypothetical protein